MKKRLAIVTTHPIQYNAPLFELLHKRNRTEVKVFYTWGKDSSKEKFDPGFRKMIEWDIPLLKGYNYEFLKNTAKDPGSHHYNGIINPNIIRAISAWQPDAILVYGWSFKSHLRVIRYFYRKTFILFRGDSIFLNDSRISLRKSFRKVVLKWVYKHIDAALYVGKYNYDYYKACGVPENKLWFAPHAVDNLFFQDLWPMYEMKAADWRNEMGITKSEFVFLFAGKFEPKKNPLLLINAFKSLNDPSCRLIMVGNGVLEKKLKNCAKEDGRIIFIDFQNQQTMPIVYRLCEVFVLPSQGPNETWGLSVNEAMASSRSILVSNKCGCHIDLVKQGENGYIFDSNNLNDLVEKLYTFMKRKHEIRIMGKNSLSLIQIWNYIKTSETIEQLLSSYQKNNF